MKPLLIIGAVVLAIILLLSSCSRAVDLNIARSVPSAPAASNTSAGAAGVLRVSADNLPNGWVGSPYEIKLPVTGGVEPYDLSISKGRLPDGVRLSSNSILIGTPTSRGDYSFTVQVKDSTSAAVSQTFSIHVN